jgi:TonB family protein
MTGLLTLANLFAWSAQVAVLVVAALAALRLVRLAEPSIRYAFLRIVLAACLILPLVQPRQPARASFDGRVVSHSATATVAGNPTQSPVSSMVLGLSQLRWMTVLMFCLAAGTFGRLLWIGAGIVRLRRLRRAGELAAGDEEHQELQSIIRTRAAIRYVSGLGQPVTFGFRHPVVLLPASLCTWSAGIRRAVLAHELWHVRRKDWMWTVAEETLRAVLWFHPAIWALLSRIQSSREEVVDELTILTIGSRRSYFHALLAYANEPPLFAATAFARRRHLVNRLVLISKEAVMSARRVVACCAVLAVVILSASWYAVQAFPMVQAQSASDLQADPGPVERRAKPITPENPVPRRTRYVEADYPRDAEAANLKGKLTVRIALDESGHVAESRVTGFSVTMGDGVRFHSVVSSPAIYQAGSSPSKISPETMLPLLKSLSQSALNAVNQWQYAAPADGPIAFNADVWFGAPPPPPPPPPAPRDAPAGPPPPPPPPPRPGDDSASNSGQMTDDALRVGGSIKAPIKLRHVNPIYPPDAQIGKVQGVVIIEARIERDGTVSQTKVLRSIPLLDDAAVDAVRQWEFTPTWLNGEPVPIIMTVTVNFTLQ